MTDLTVPAQLLNEVDLPKYQTEGASGVDLYAAIDHMLFLKPGTRVIIPTGIMLAIPYGFEAQVRSRSGLAARHGIIALNSPGTIDSDYRGEIKVILANFGESSHPITPGSRIAQLVFAPVVKVIFKTVETLPNTKRGIGGFGSTGSTEPIKTD